MDAWQEIEELRQQLARLAMVGRVSDVNEAKRQVRVIWPASGETSGWLLCPPFSLLYSSCRDSLGDSCKSFHRVHAN